MFPLEASVPVLTDPQTEVPHAARRMTMRILHLIPTFSGGGAERQLALLTRQLVADGHDIAIGYHSGGPNLALLEGTGVTLFPLTLRGHHDPTQLLKVYRVIRKWQPDIVQTWLPQMDIIGGLAARIASVPHILSERASGPAYGSDWKSRVRLWLGRKARAVIANSAVGAAYWQERGAVGSIHVVANAVTPFAFEQAGPPADAQRPYILYAGRLAAQKNLENMITGLAAALAALPGYSVQLLGAGPQEGEVRAWIDRSATPGRIHLRGYVDDLQAWYVHAALFISVSDFEGNPNVVLEAASMGCPLILSDIPEHREAILPDGALWVDGHDPGAIAAAVRRCLDEPAAAVTRASVAKSVVAGLSMVKKAAEYTQIYRAVAPNDERKVAPNES